MGDDTDLLDLLGDNITMTERLSSPLEFRKQFPVPYNFVETVRQGRSELENILDGKGRTAIIVGPCSIHDEEEALEYARQLKILSDRVSDKFMIIMRTYFEKPRTCLGWPGLIDDPGMDSISSAEEGYQKVWKILIGIAELGLPVQTEFLNTQTPLYIGGLVTCASIGARTSETQDFKKMASGLSMPIGFKNSVGGRVTAAINGAKVASLPNKYRGIDIFGNAAVISTKGNQYSYIILRGGDEPNYFSSDVYNAQQDLALAGLPRNVVIDCSHGNSRKDHTKQPEVFSDVMSQISSGNDRIVGVMIESNLKEGNQRIPTDKNDLQKGVSVTDACLPCEDTQEIILEEYFKDSKPKTMEYRVAV
ncbi:3-deoxy-7-phosphoheptulonate synthase [Candidatus Woesearchaeota archaeon]|nr:3-deoxy-7-phosphoheptulonate synthase [Candidatus Woesearchaeota archaeon]